ncbi:MAG: zinc-binding dehydrogenase [Nocardioides sp.]|nr:zinc-binding dehydrogenase [Nocardioides sp.]
MKALWQEQYGGPETLTVRQEPIPAPGSGEVLVRVRAASIDLGTHHLMAGLPLVMRLGTGLRAPRQHVPGRAFAGVVEAVGEGVIRFVPGDAVLGTASGSLAELAVARDDRLAPKPASLGFAEAAALPVSAVTALQGLRDVRRIEPGQSVLVIGASGGVGIYAVQLARAFGAGRVDAVCSGAKADLVRSLGADDVVDCSRGELDAEGRRWDLVLDIAGNRPVAALRRLLTPRGTLVSSGVRVAADGSAACSARWGRPRSHRWCATGWQCTSPAGTAATWRPSVSSPTRGNSSRPSTAPTPSRRPLWPSHGSKPVRRGARSWSPSAMPDLELISTEASPTCRNSLPCLRWAGGAGPGAGADPPGCP